MAYLKERFDLIVNHLTLDAFNDGNISVLVLKCGDFNVGGRAG